jgi:hypothetical protein
MSAIAGFNSYFRVAHWPGLTVGDTGQHRSHSRYWQALVHRAEITADTELLALYLRLTRQRSSLRQVQLGTG